MFTDNVPSGFNMNYGGHDSHGGGGGFGGRRFGGGGSHYGNYGHDGGGNLPRRSKVFTPVTLKMVNESQARADDVCEFDGEPINDVIIVGRLLRRIEEPMRTQFEVNDNTNAYIVIFYHKGENQVPTALRTFQYEQFTYVKIHGNIRVFKDQKAIVGSHIKRIEKFDEVTNHFLSAFVSHCIRKKGILKPKDITINGAAASAINKNLDIHMEAVAQESAIQKTPHELMPGYSKPNAAPGPIINEEDLRRKVIEAMKDTLRFKQFISRDEISTSLQSEPGFNPTLLEPALNRLMNEGVIVNAHDNHHFFFV